VIAVVDIVLAALAVLVVLGGVAFLLARHWLRRLRRRAAGWKAQLLDARTQLLPPGPRREAALLRATLQAEIGSTREMLESARLVFRADATAVLAELTTAAAALDAELQAIGRFRDAHQQRVALVTVHPQVTQLIETSYSVRQTLLRTAAGDRNRQLAALRESAAFQAAALDAYRRSGGELSL
jgi:hypothetical protein